MNDVLYTLVLLGVFCAYALVTLTVSSLLVWLLQQARKSYRSKDGRILML